MQCIGSNSGKRFPISRCIFPEQGIDKQCNDRICFFRKKFCFLPERDSQAAITVDKSLSLSQGFTIKSAAPFFREETASSISPKAVINTTSGGFGRSRIRSSQKSPSPPLCFPVPKFISNKTTPTSSSRSKAGSKVGTEAQTTILNSRERIIRNVLSTASLSSTTIIFPFLITKAKIYGFLIYLHKKLSHSLKDLFVTGLFAVCFS